MLPASSVHIRPTGARPLHQNAPVPRPSRPRRRSLAAALVLVTVDLACAVNPTGGPDSLVDAAAPPRCDGRSGTAGRVVLWHPFTEGRQRQALDGALAAYRRDHPDHPVDAVAVDAQDEAGRLGDAHPREAPDALVITEADLPRLVDSGRTFPAEACLPAAGGPAPERFWPAVRRAWSAQGRLWAVPLTASVPVLWVNRERLGGRPVPTTRAGLAATLDGLHHAGGGPALRYDLELAFILAERWSAARGAPLTDRDAQGHPRVHLDGAGVRDDLVWLRDLDHRGLIASYGSDASGDDLVALATPSDTAALAVQSSASAGEALARIEAGTLDPSLGELAPLPRPGPGATGPDPPPEGIGLVLTTGHADPAAAADLAAYLSRPSTQAAMAAAAGTVPAVRGAEAEPALAGAFRRYPSLRVAFDAVTGDHGDPDPPDQPVRIGPYGELRRTVIDAYRRILHDEDPATVLRDAQAIASQQLALYESAHGR